MTIMYKLRHATRATFNCLYRDDFKVFALFKDCSFLTGKCFKIGN